MTEKTEQKTKKNKVVLWCIIAFLAFIVLHGIYASLTKEDTTQEKLPNPAIAQAVTTRINYVLENLKPEWPELVNVECSGDCANADVNFIFSEAPSDPDINDFTDVVARGQAVNLSTAIYEVAPNDSKATSHILVNGVEIYTCTADKKTIKTCQDKR